MKIKSLLIAGAVASVFLTTSSCKTPQNVEKTTVAVKVSTPFSESKYKSDKDFFRAKNSGKSIDLATSKKMAMLNAKTELAANIKAVIKSVTDQYTNQRNIGDKEDFENKLEQLTREVVDQTLTDIKVIDEEIYKETDGRYTYWVAIETSKVPVLDAVASKISKNEKLQLDYDKKKFEEVFNSEMDKMSKEQ
jgi:hypothetical protein